MPVMIQSLINVIEEKNSIVSVTPGIIVVDEAQLFDNSFLGVVKNSLNISELKKLTVKTKYIKKFNDNLKIIQKEFLKIKNKDYGLNTRYPVPKTVFQSLHNIQECLQSSENIELFGILNKNPYAKYEDLIFNILNTKDSISWMSIAKENEITFIPKNFYKKNKRMDSKVICL